MRRTDALIAGGGPAGAATAIALAGAGMRPLLIERSEGPHDIVCGGFLGGDALAALDALGIDIDALHAPRIGILEMFAGQRSASVDLPFRAAGLSRTALDAALLEHAASLGAGIERGVTIRRADAEQRTLMLADDTIIGGEAIFLATGKYELRGMARQASTAAEMPVGLRSRLEVAPKLQEALRGVIQLHLFRRGYAGLLLQEDGSANLCLTIAGDRFKALGGKPESVLRMLVTEAPRLADQLGLVSDFGEWATIARVPYGWRTATTTPGIFRVGDQAAVIASLAGDGIAIALESGRRAGETFVAGGADHARHYQRRFSATARRPLWLAERLRGWAEYPATAALGVTGMGWFPGLARAASRMTRVGGY